MAFYSNMNTWTDLGAKYYVYDNSFDLIASVKEAKAAMEKASSDVALDYQHISSSTIDNLLDFQHALQGYCDSIHYAICDDIDLPFSSKMDDLADKLVAINPSNYKLDNLCDLAYVTGHFPAFGKLYNSLNTDAKDGAAKTESAVIDFYESDMERTHKLAEAENEWIENEIDAKIKAENPDLDFDNLSEEEKEAKREEIWNKMTPDERKAAYERYYDTILPLYYGDTPDYSSEELKIIYDVSEPQYSGEYNDNWYKGIYLNPWFIDDASNNSFREGINIINHETRHSYQYSQTYQEDTEGIGNIQEDFSVPSTSSRDSRDNYYRNPKEVDARGYAGISDEK